MRAQEFIDEAIDPKSGRGAVAPRLTVKRTPDRAVPPVQKVTQDPVRTRYGDVARHDDPAQTTMTRQDLEDMTRQIQVARRLGDSINEIRMEDAFRGIDISMEREDDEIMVRASAGGKQLGSVLFVDYDGELMPQDLEVDERFRGQGIAQAMYDYVKSQGYRIRRSGQQTDAGAGFWGKHRPDTNVWENFADGKVKGKSRPGRVKRSGASCNGSVTDLRRKAKNASGEKAKMYHWCANMKSGRKKAK